MKLDLEELEELPTNKIDGFGARLEALMPSLCSKRSIVMPNVPFATTNDLIAARPKFLSKVAQTTTESARSPEVTNIFSPFKI